MEIKQNYEPLEKVLPLKNAADYKCKIYRYKLTHHLLFIEIENTLTSTLTYIRFSDVYYFSGKMQWLGANFVTMNTKETLNFLHLLENSEPNEEIDNALSPLKVYTVQETKPVVQIVAASAYWFYVLPSDAK